MSNEAAIFCGRGFLREWLDKTGGERHNRGMGEEKAKLAPPSAAPLARRARLLRSQIESRLAKRIPAPFTFCSARAFATVSTGTPHADALTGGLPRGEITEICGPNSSGRTSLLMAALASRTAQVEACAFVDARDAFDPYSAEACGVKLKQLLWVRCRNIDQALRATDLLLHAGGFGLVALDLGDFPPEIVRYIPLNVWYRFRRAVDHTPTIFLVLEQEPHAKACASLVLRMEKNAAQWKNTTRDQPELPPPSHACLFAGSWLSARVVRSRARPAGRLGSADCATVALESTYDSRGGDEVRDLHAYGSAAGP